MRRNPVKTARIKLQTTEIHDVEFNRDDGGDKSVGQFIDGLIDDALSTGRIPTKVALEINPPTLADDARL